MADSTDSGVTPHDHGEAVAQGARLPPAAGEGSLTADRKIGVKADEAGDNDIVTAQSGETGHVPTGGTGH